MFNTLILLYALLFAYLTWRRGHWALFILFATLPSYLIRWQILTVPSTLLEVMILIVLLVWFIKTEQKFATLKNLIDNNLLRWPILLFLLATTVAIIVAPDLRSALGYWKAYAVEPILLFFILSQLIGEEKNQQAVLYGLGTGTIIISLIAVWQKLTGWELPPGWFNPATRRVISVFTSPNAVGLYLMPIVLLYLGWLKQNWSKNLKATAWFKILVIILSLLAIIFTRSRGAWFGGLVGLVFFLFFSWSKTKTLVIGAAAALVSLLLPAWRNLVLPALGFKVTSGLVRLQLWQWSEQLLQQHWLWGLGWGGFEIRHQALAQTTKAVALLYPHNIFLNFWLETGVFGLLAIIWLLILIFYLGFKYLKLSTTPHYLLGLLAAIVVIIAHGLVDVPYFKNDLAIIFWLLPALLVATLGLIKKPNGANI